MAEPASDGSGRSADAAGATGRRRLGRRSLLAIFAATAAATIPIAGAVASASAPSAAAPAAKQVGRLRRWAMVIDLRRCDGCQSIGKPPQCTQACIEGHFAPQPMEWIEIYEAPIAGRATQFIPTPCQHCQNAPCVNVCPVGATFHTPEGTVLIDQQRCIGCRICMEACPYDRRFFNWGTAPQPPETLFMQYDAEHQSPAIKGTVMKCDLCPDMARAGRLPYCAAACPNKAIYYGDLEEDLATNGAEVVSLSRFLATHASYRLKEDLGTEPRVHYIPGHGEAVGRDPYRKGRLATEWPWQQRVQGAKTWKR